MEYNEELKVCWKLRSGVMTVIGSSSMYIHIHPYPFNDLVGGGVYRHRDVFKLASINNIILFFACFSLGVI
jgi:hypothetical protein